MIGEWFLIVLKSAIIGISFLHAIIKWHGRISGSENNSIKTKRRTNY